MPLAFDSRPGVQARRVTRWLVAGGLLLGSVVWADEHLEASGSMSSRMAVLALELAVIFCGAKIGGFVAQRYLRMPEVLGELLAGVALGPYALGPWLHVFPLPATPDQFPISPELYGIASLAAVILMYLTGLETDLSMFLRYSVVGSAVGLGGVLVSFVLGDLIAVWAGMAQGFLDPAALFLGTVSTATSVGITARLLEERRQLHSPEGVTIIAGAVIDDILGIIVLAMVIGYVKVAARGGTVVWGDIGWLALKTFGIAGLAAGISLLFAKQVGRALTFFGRGDRTAVLSLGLALLLAGLLEKAGLALIIGAYIMGLALSRNDCAPELKRRLEPIYRALVSVFFCVMGMLVDVRTFKVGLVFGLLYTLVAIVTKIVGCGLPARLLRFNWLGALRVGIGMVPRGEVALIVAGIGFASGAVSKEILSIAIMMTLLTTVLAPLLLVRLFGVQSGLQPRYAKQVEALRELRLEVGSQELAEVLILMVIKTFQHEGAYVMQPVAGDPIYHVRLDDIQLSARRDGQTLVLEARPADYQFARLALSEALASLIRTFDQFDDHRLRAQVRTC